MGTKLSVERRYTAEVQFSKLFRSDGQHWHVASLNLIALTRRGLLVIPSCKLSQFLIPQSVEMQDLYFQSFFHAINNNCFWVECPAEFHTTKFRWNFMKFFGSARTKLMYSIKFHGIPWNVEFHEIKIPQNCFWWNNGHSTCLSTLLKLGFFYQFLFLKNVYKFYLV